VTATDVGDKLFVGANRRKYILVAALGIDILVAAPESAYQLTTDTFVAAAEVSGIVALLLERNPKTHARRHPPHSDRKCKAARAGVETCAAVTRECSRYVEPGTAAAACAGTYFISRQSIECEERREPGYGSSL
jgi:hypothetical protein